MGTAEWTIIYIVRFLPGLCAPVSSFSQIPRKVFGSSHLLWSDLMASLRTSVCGRLKFHLIETFEHSEIYSLHLSERPMLVAAGQRPRLANVRYWNEQSSSTHLTKQCTSPPKCPMNNPPLCQSRSAATKIRRIEYVPGSARGAAVPGSTIARWRERGVQ